METSKILGAALMAAGLMDFLAVRVVLEPRLREHPRSGALLGAVRAGAVVLLALGAALWEGWLGLPSSPP